MADDLDDLLEQVERDFCPSTNKTPPSSNQESTESDIDQAIKELLIDDEKQEVNSTSTATTHQSLQLHHNKSPQTEMTKCHTVLLGGSTCVMGLNNNHNINKSCDRSCDKLRCLSCDFNIEWFDDYIWKSSVDYIFFRNNFPNRRTLRTHCVPSKGSRAYCCQCSWRSIDNHQTVNITHDNALKWICSKHI